MIDTLSISLELKESGLSEQEANAIASTIGKIMTSELSSKKDLEDLRAANKKDLEDHRAANQKDLELLRASLQKEIQETKANLQKEIQETKAELQKEIELVRLEIKNVELRIVEKLNLQSDKMNNHLKWVAGFLVGQTALLYTLVKFLG